MSEVELFFLTMIALFCLSVLAQRGDAGNAFAPHDGGRSTDHSAWRRHGGWSASIGLDRADRVGAGVGLGRLGDDEAND